MALNKPTGEMLDAGSTATPSALGTAAAGTSASYSKADHVHAFPSFSGDISNVENVVTVAKIQGNLVSGSTPVSGQVLSWDGTNWTPTTNSSGGGGGANGLTYYLNQGTAADAPTTGIAPTPKQLGRIGEVAQSTLTSATLTQNVWTRLAGFISESTPIDPNTGIIPGGLWDFNLWCFGDANSNAGTSIRCVVYKYNGTTLTEIASPSSDQIINGTSAQYSLSVLVPQTTLQLTDRIYVAIEARASASNHTVTLQFGDSTPSHIHTSLNLVGGTGLWKNSSGILQSPASLLLNTDVDAAAGINWSKIEASYLGTTVKIVGRDALSIQDCINLCTDAFSDKNYTILIPPKQYTETLTLRSSVSLVGLTGAGSSQGVQIVGNHSWTGTGSTNQPNNNRIGLKDICFVSGGLTAATISCPNATYHSQLSLSGCVFSGPKNDGISTILVGDNVSCYLDNSKIQNAGTSAGTASNGLSITNGSTYLSNNTYFETYGRAIDIQPSATAFYASGSWTTSSTTVTVADTSVLGVGWTVTGTLLTGASSYIVSITNSTQFVLSATPTIAGPNYLQFACARIGNSNGTVYTLTTGTIAGLAVGMKVSGGNITGNTTTIASLSTGVVTLSSPVNPAIQTGITLTFGGSAYLEMHDTNLFSTKGAEVLRVQSGLFAASQSSFTNVATGGVGVGGNGINIAVPGAGLGLVNSSFIISDASAGMYAITGVSGSYAALSSISYSNSILKAYQTAINSNVTVADYTARATSIENGGTGATTRQAALNALAGAATNLAVLAGNGTNVTLRLLAAADIPNLDTGKLTTGTLAVTRGGTGQISYTDGQLLIGNTTGNTLTKGTLTAGTGIAISNTAGAITISNTGSGTGTVTTSGSPANGNIAKFSSATAITAATASTDYISPAAGTGHTAGQIWIGNSAGGLTRATLTVNAPLSIANGDGSITLSATGAGTGTVVTTGSPATGNMTKFSGAVSITPAIAGTDYSAGTAALGTGIVKSTTTTGALTIAVASDLNTAFGSQIANYIYAAPSGSAGNPAFRAMTGADVPPTFTQTQTFVAGTTTVAPAKFQAGSKLTTPAAHALEWDGSTISITALVSLLGTWTTGTNTVTVTTGTTAGLVVGAAILTGITGTTLTIASITGLNTFTLSANATNSGTTLAFTVANRDTILTQSSFGTY